VADDRLHHENTGRPNGLGTARHTDSGFRSEPLATSGSLVLDPDLQAKARQYAGLRRRMAFVSLGTGAVYLVLWISNGWGPGLSEALESATWGAHGAGLAWWVEVLVVAGVLGAPWGLINLPLDYYIGFVLPHRFQLSTQSRAGWLADVAKGTLLSILLGSPLLVGMYSVMRATPDRWWLWSAIGFSGVSIALSAVAPVLLMPIFFKFRPLDEVHSELNARLLELARRSGTPVRGVFTFDMSRRTRAANAALVGLGRTRRIILGDTLLSEFNVDEIETVLAHELGHHVHADIPLLIAAQSGVTLVSFFLVAQTAAWLFPYLGLASIADPGGVPAVTLLLGATSLAGVPFANAFSRWRETLADDYSVRLTRNPSAFAQALIRLANQNLAEAEPPWWAVLLLSSHPPLGHRIRRAVGRIGTGVE